MAYKNKILICKSNISKNNKNEILEAEMTEFGQKKKKKKPSHLCISQDYWSLAVFTQNWVISCKIRKMKSLPTSGLVPFAFKTIHSLYELQTLACHITLPMLALFLDHLVEAYQVYNQSHSTSHVKFTCMLITSCVLIQLSDLQSTSICIWGEMVHQEIPNKQICEQLLHLQNYPTTYYCHH